MAGEDQFRQEVPFATNVTKLSTRHNPVITALGAEFIAAANEGSGLNTNLAEQKIFIIYCDPDTGEYAIVGNFAMSAGYDPNSPLNAEPGEFNPDLVTDEKR